MAEREYVENLAQGIAPAGSIKVGAVTVEVVYTVNGGVPINDCPTAELEKLVNEIRATGRATVKLNVCPPE